MSPHLALIALYSVLLVGAGLWLSRHVKTAADFFVAGRRLGPGLLFSTMQGANLGAGWTVGAAGLGYRDGIAAWWWVGSAGIGSLVLAFTVGPRIWRASSQLDLHTVGDFLDRRYSPLVSGSVSALLWVGTLAILAGQLIALAWVLNVVAGLPKTAGCLIGGLVMTTYFVAGGLLVSAWINMLQLGVLLAGFAVALPIALGDVGGWQGLVELALNRRPIGDQACIDQAGPQPEPQREGMGRRRAPVPLQKALASRSTDSWCTPMALM